MKLLFALFLVALFLVYVWVRDGCPSPFKKLKKPLSEYLIKALFYGFLAFLSFSIGVFMYAAALQRGWIH